jgi:hypothetical protein
LLTTGITGGGVTTFLTIGTVLGGVSSGSGAGGGGSGVIKLTNISLGGSVLGNG